MAQPRIQKHHPETADRILAAAEEAFAAHGMAGARTERIAARAGVNKALLYYYFRSKRNLYRAVLRHLLEQLQRTGEPGAQSSSAREQLAGFVNRYFDFLATHPNFPRLIQREVLESKGELDWVMRDYYRPLLEGLVRLIANGIRCGEFRRVDPQQSALSLMGATTSYFAAPLWGRFLGRELLEPAALEARRRALLDFLGYGLFRAERGQS